MTLEQIKTAVENGQTVHWSTDSYTVIKDNIGQWLIAYNRGQRDANYIGLTWQDGKTMNCNSPDEFYIAKRKG